MHRLDMADLMHIATTAVNAKQLLAERRDAAFAAAAKPTATDEARSRGLQMLADLERSKVLVS